MGLLKMITGIAIFVIALVVVMQPLLTILDGTQEIRDAASTTPMYGKDTNGDIVAVGYANAGGDATEMLLFGIGFFMVIGFIVWLIMRAPNEPDYGAPYDGGSF